MVYEGLGMLLRRYPNYVPSGLGLVLWRAWVRLDTLTPDSLRDQLMSDRNAVMGAHEDPVAGLQIFLMSRGAIPKVFDGG